jgi:hypothetical protein
MIHSSPKPFGSHGVEPCCLIIEGRETHHSLAREFHTAAFALRLVVTAFTNREGDFSRRKCVAASDQNFVRFVTPHRVRVNARCTETVARQRRSDRLRHDMCLGALCTMQPRKIQCDQLWSSFPGKPGLQRYQRETDEQKHKHGSDSEKKLQLRSGISGQIRRRCLGPEFKSWDSGSYAQVGTKPNPRLRRSSASSANCIELGSWFNISDSLPMIAFSGKNAFWTTGNV